MSAKHFVLGPQKDQFAFQSLQYTGMRNADKLQSRLPPMPAFGKKSDALCSA